MAIGLSRYKICNFRQKGTPVQRLDTRFLIEYYFWAWTFLGQPFIGTREQIAYSSELKI